MFARRLLFTAGLLAAAGFTLHAARGQDAADRPQWIWLEQNGRPAEQVFFRKVFEVPGGVTAAKLYATCDNRMTIYLDGREVLSGSEWSRPAFADVTELMEASPAGGRHVLAVAGANDPDSPAGLLVQLELEFDGQPARSVLSDASWRAALEAGDRWQAADLDASGWRPVEVLAPLGGGPWTQVNRRSLAAAARQSDPVATPVESLKVAEGFNVELLYSVPKDQHGSWVSMCVDPKGRLIVSDQYGGLFRVTPPAAGSGKPPVVEEIAVQLGEAQGLLWAFDRLYVMVNRGEKYASGLYQVRDTDGDDSLDTVTLLRKIDGGGEHGPHAVLPTPDGQGLYVVCGNGTNLPEIDTSRVPQVWDEDLLLPRPYGRGFMRGKRPPAGFICRIDPEAKHWELVAAGFRNEYDAALNADGELFTFDADMEWDMNTPWYRPTRVCHVVSGAEFGWRNGGGKWPVHYPDSLPPVVDIGPGSPTGIAFGYGAKFPAAYQRALFISDWSYGKLYAVHLAPEGASYAARTEEFITGTPLPLTDLVINPRDGAMYFMIGGRRVQSGLYRVTYTGSEPTEPAELRDVQGTSLRALRHELEKRHVGNHPDAVEFAWPHLGHSDRFLRYAARIAIEHRPVSEWQDRALQETDPRASLTALLALARQFERPDKGSGADIDTPLPSPAQAAAFSDEHLALGQQIRKALQRLDWNALRPSERIALLRVHTLAFLRLGSPDAATRRQLIAEFSPRLPSGDATVDSELAQLLVYLQDPAAAAKVVALLDSAPTQEQQIDYAKTLRHLSTGWTRELQERYFRWFNRAASYRGGASFALFVENIKSDAVARLDDAERAALASILEAKPSAESAPDAGPQREFVREWVMEDLVPLIESGLKERDFQRGRQLFAAASCFACHRYDGTGGAVGPDLSGLAGRFSPRDILESIVQPNKVISDQYEAVTVLTYDGRVITGRIVNLSGNSISINTDMLDPNQQVGVDRQQIEEMFPSKTSMMPSGLLNTLEADEVLDLMAYLLSQGDRNHPMFAHPDAE